MRYEENNKINIQILVSNKTDYLRSVSIKNIDKDFSEYERINKKKILFRKLKNYEIIICKQLKISGKLKFFSSQSKLIATLFIFEIKKDYNK